MIRTDYDKFGLSEADLRSIQEVFTHFPEIKEVIVYGSRAKGNYRPGSDLDLVVFGEDINLSLLNNISSELEELLLPINIDLSSYEYLESKSLKEHIRRVGRKLL
jgi:predicted nucleotidyltransferase